MSWSNGGDRTSMVPKHGGRNVLPCSPLFNRLLRFARIFDGKPAIRDVPESLEKSHLDLLSDVLSLRDQLHATLQPEILRSLEAGEEIYLAVLAPGGYEYAVAMLAGLAIGAAVVPLTTALPMKEALYFVKKAKAPVVLTASVAVDLGKDIEVQMRTSDKNFRCLPIKPAIGATPLSASDILTSSDQYLDDNKPGVVIFTSGTTGPPKGAVMRRAFIHDCAASVVDWYDIKPDDVVLHVLPVHHATGVGVVFFPFLFAGATIEFKSGSFDEQWVWDRWRDGAMDRSRRLTFFSGVPTIYMRMKRHFQRHLSQLLPARLEEYVAGARQFHFCLCGTSALPRPVDDFWADLMQRRIIQRYGGTEFGAVIKVDPRKASEVPDGSVGERLPGVDLRLSDGSEGEILVKSPYMFSKYLDDPEATSKAHDKDGYFRTGDLARKEGKYYWIMGRAFLDIIKSGGYKISALDIERELLSLPYISEALVVGVSDEEFGQRVGAIITTQMEAIDQDFHERHSAAPHMLTLDRLRNDLKLRLASYKLPTLLRVIEGEIPKTATGKAQKKILGPLYFPPGYESFKEIQVWKSKGRHRGRARL